uniref:DUF3667 domain-containing protein n=1 Tax=Zeaxanthinibacter enoshimensis TaxID=392009 RepID=UPI003567C606
LSTLVAYDSRLLTTLSAMLFHPGRMTIEYLKGKRMTYTNPFRFLLSLSIIYFLLLSLTNDFRSFDNDAAKSTKEALEEKPGPDLTNSRGDSGTSETNPETLRLDSTSFFSEKNDALIAAEPGRYYNEIKAKGFWERFFKKTELYLALIRHENPVNYESLSATHQLPQTWDNRASFSLARSFYSVVKYPGSFLNAVLGRLPFATFFFLPVFAFFIWLVYIRKRYTYTDNLIFSFHNQTLMFILLIISFLVDEIFGISTAAIAFLVFSLYLYKAMRTFYGDGRLKTILKFLLLNTIFIILSGIGALALLLGSAFTY